MKKLFLSLFVAGALAFGLQSCGNDDDNGGDPVGCDVCGTYQGTANGPIKVLITSDLGIDSTLVDLPASLIVAEGTAAATLALTVNLDLEIQGTPVVVPVPVTVNYNASAKTFTASNVNVNVTPIPGINVPVKITSITGAFVGANVTANVQIDDQDGASADNIDGDIDFAGTKN
jgi:hypothetical protein